MSRNAIHSAIHAAAGSNNRAVMSARAYAFITVGKVCPSVCFYCVLS